MQADDHTGINILTGNAVYKDSAQGIAVLANSIVSNRNDGTFLATQNPLLILKQDKDSVYIAADTLYSGKLSDLRRELDSLRRRDSTLQANALQDSLLAIATAKDSALRKQDPALSATASRDSLQAVADAKDTALRKQDSALTTTAPNDTLPAGAVAKDSSLLRSPAGDSVLPGIASAPPDPVKDTAASSPPDTLAEDIARRDSLAPPADPQDALLEKASRDSLKLVATRDSLINALAQDSLKNIAARDSLLQADRRDSLSFSLADSAPAEKNRALLQDSLAEASSAPPPPAALDPLSEGLAREPATVNMENDSADRYFRAYHNVRIFSDSLQAVCDSLFYSGKDSIFRLFQDPIVWASASQVTGDTIYLYTKNKKADEMYVFEDGFVVNKSGENMFNQIRGNRLNGYFKDGEMDYMRAKGNAESVYYIKDGEDKLIGVNKATADVIDMRFVNKELNRVIFVSQVKGAMYPVSQVPEEDKQLRNFKWLEEKRPKTKFELFGN